MERSGGEIGRFSYGSTYLFKLADGVFNNNWHLRYFVFDGKAKELTYFKTDKDKKARGHFKLVGATVSDIGNVKSKPFAFTVTSK